jgi:hypothetical protein
MSIQEIKEVVDLVSSIFILIAITIAIAISCFLIFKIRSDDIERTKQDIKDLEQ